MGRGVETNQGVPRDGIFSKVINRALYYGSAPGPTDSDSEHRGNKPSTLSKVLLAVGGAAIIALAFGQLTTGKIAKK